MAFKTEETFFQSKSLEFKFTDREEPQKLFWEKYDHLDLSRNEHDIIHFYGIGGIGKTALLKRLRNDLVSRKNGKVILYSFENNPSKEHFLFSLARQISILLNAQFPVFSYAYIRLLRNQGMNDEEIELRLKNDNTGILSNGDEHKDTRKRNIIKIIVDFIKVLLSIGTNFVPLLGNTMERVGESLIDMFLDRISRNKKEAVDKGIDDMGRGYLMQIDDMQNDSSEIIKNLHT